MDHDVSAVKCVREESSDHTVCSRAAQFRHSRPTVERNNGINALGFMVATRSEMIDSSIESFGRWARLDFVVMILHS